MIKKGVRRSGGSKEEERGQGECVHTMNRACTCACACAFACACTDLNIKQFWCVLRLFFFFFFFSPLSCVLEFRA